MKKIVIHPFLFGIYAIIFLVSVNLKRIPFSASHRVLKYQLIVIVILFVLFEVISHSWYRAGLVTSLAVILFNSYGHVYNYLVDKRLWGISLGRADILAALWATAFILIGWWFIRKLSNPEKLSEYFNILSVMLLIIPTLNIADFYVRQIYYTGLSDKMVDYEKRPTNHPNQRSRDIYYLILDEYGREDVLYEIMSFDNSELLQHLKEIGFYIADDSHTNYAITQFSLQSSLNLDYLYPDDKANVYSALKLIHHNRARRFLEEQGYQFVTFATGYSQTDITDADYYFKPSSYVNGFEFMYFLSSVLVHNIDDFYFSQSRELITNTFERLRGVSRINPITPKFVFAHIPAVHVPYVFGPEGELEEPWTLPVGVIDPVVARQGYIDGYTGQLTYINKLLKDTINAILSESEIDPIIIIQGDHGPQVYYDFSFESPCIKERLAILNAYYLPGFEYNKLYTTISPVNTFRLIFAHYFGADFDLLKDRSLLTMRDDLSEIIDATDQWNECNIP